MLCEATELSSAIGHSTHTLCVHCDDFTVLAEWGARRFVDRVLSKYFSKELANFHVLSGDDEWADLGDDEWT